MVSEVFRVCSVLSGTEADGPLLARSKRHERNIENYQNNPQVTKRRGPEQEC